MKRYESIAANSKMYFGSNIPSLFMNGDFASNPRAPLAVKDADGTAPKSVYVDEV